MRREVRPPGRQWPNAAARPTSSPLTSPRLPTRSDWPNAPYLGQGHVDILINNAALYPRLSTADQDAEELTLLFNVNVRAPFILAKTLVPHMFRRGNGVIINLGSIAGLTGLPTTAADGLTKAALTSLSRTWAAEYGSQGVRINTVTRGPRAPRRWPTSSRISIPRPRWGGPRGTCRSAGQPNPKRSPTSSPS
jgi:NAD(P)-dependent dehydrogenase (short-subunit alcohol dehydrogenase family)